MTRDALRWGIALVALASALVTVYTTYRESRPCAETITYRVGSVDPRFGISEASVRARAATAAAIWNRVAGKTVLAYDADAELTINLPYDEREAAAQLGREIALQQAAEERVREAIDRDQAQFDALQSDYNSKVAAINARGGATSAEAAALAREREQLEALAAANNGQVAAYNARVAARNATIAEYNKSAGRTYEEGQYVRDAEGERINIFVYVDDTQLARVLAHEFGHALGLEHNDDPAAIMYAQNESGSLTPSSADIAALTLLCKL